MDHVSWNKQLSFILQSPEIWLKPKGDDLEQCIGRSKSYKSELQSSLPSFFIAIQGQKKPVTSDFIGNSF